jgi:hypothetical protein
VTEAMLGHPTEIAQNLKPAVEPLIREWVAADLPS